jgi:hypothetical protein
VPEGGHHDSDVVSQSADAIKFYFRSMGYSCLFFGLGVWVVLQYIPDALALGDAMVKEPKFFRKQAAKAERMARAVSDTEISQSFLNLAKAYRSQADMLKTKKLKTKKKSGKKRRRPSGLF